MGAYPCTEPQFLHTPPMLPFSPPFMSSPTENPKKTTCASEFGRWGKGWALRPCAGSVVGGQAQLWPPGHHDARIPQETLRWQQDPHAPGRALPVHLRLHQDLGKVGTWREMSASPCWGVSTPCTFSFSWAGLREVRGIWQGWDGVSLGRGCQEKR